MAFRHFVSKPPQFICFTTWFLTFIGHARRKNLWNHDTPPTPHPPYTHTYTHYVAYIYYYSKCDLYSHGGNLVCGSPEWLYACFVCYCIAFNLEIIYFGCISMNVNINTILNSFWITFIQCLCLCLILTSLKYLSVFLVSMD